MTALTLDRIALTDIGGQPRHLAAEIQRQMREHLGELPLPIPLGNIATALGIEEVIERSTEAFEGMLVTSPDKSRGTIVLRAGMVRGRRNFTCGHEIGHFVNPYHQPPTQGFVCDSAGMKAQRKSAEPWASRSPFERMEVEANEFAVSLLVPPLEFRRERGLLAGCDLRHIEPLAKRFGTSKEVMGRIYVDTASETIGILTSRHGTLQRFILPEKFPYLGLSKGRPLPSRSRSASFLGSQVVGAASELEAVPAEAWLDRSDKSIELFEQAAVQSDGWGMTLLLADEPSDDQREEDEEVERRWSEPRFAYGR
ncbi:MAG TPA: ImmA/IrrE family metallo-endopeptidase [Caulobacteraceae bacterium]|nr:ImmA/IrrE family metallo-endopeptidase [Caulobacteraceae bacterium]